MAVVERLIVNVFPGIANIPLLAARVQGFFAPEGLRVEVQRTPSSLAQRAALLEGAADIGHAAFDEVVAGVEEARADLVAVLGGDGGFQALYARPPVRRIGDLRGRSVAVDDPETAHALVLRKILRLGGLNEGAYALRPVGSTSRRFDAMRQDAAIAASMFSPPFSILAEDLGWRRLGGTADLLGPYQGTVGFCRRAWLARNGEALARYLRGYLKGLRWSLDPAHRSAVAEATAEALRVALPIARRSCAIALEEPGGLAPEAALEEEGMRRVLAVRAEIRGQWGGTPPAPDGYVDLGPYRDATAGLA